MISSFKSSPRSSTSTQNAASTELPSTVLPSSTELFFFYRETLEQCAKLSRKTAFLDLCGVYQKWLKTYAVDVLGAALNPQR
jgi:vacuolar protein sorting-associated protein 53